MFLGSGEGVYSDSMLSESVSGWAHDGWHRLYGYSQT